MMNIMGSSRRSRPMNRDEQHQLSVSSIAASSSSSGSRSHPSAATPRSRNSRSTSRSSGLLVDVLQHPFPAQSPFNRSKQDLMEFSDEFVVDEAEATVVKVLEERKRFASADYGESGWKPSAIGERPPIPNMPSALPPQRPQPPTTPPSKAARSRFVDAVRRVQRMKSMRSMADVTKAASSRPSTLGYGDRARSAATAASVRQKRSSTLTGMDNSNNSRIGTDHPDLDNISMIASHNRHRRVKSEGLTGTDLLMEDAEAVEDLFGNDDVFKATRLWKHPKRTRGTSTDSKNSAEEAEKLMRNSSHFEPQGPELAAHLGEHRADEVLPLIEAQRTYGSNTSLSSTEVVINHPKKPRKWRIVSGVSGLAEVLNAHVLRKKLRNLLAVVVFVVIPLVCTAFVLFYKLSNPSLDFLPGDATLSWWCLFFARQAITFELGRKTQYLGVDILALRSRWVVKIFGPLFTLWLIQARGWPFVLTSWALYDCILLHGDNVFQKNWLFWTNLEIFSGANPGADILNSSMYFRILMAAMLTGFLHAVKRTYVALYFGRRTFLDYKPKLEKILGDLVAVTEVVGLVTDLEHADRNLDADAHDGTLLHQPSQASVMSSVSSAPPKKKREAKWAGVAFQNSARGLETVADDDDDDDDDEIEEEDDGMVTPTPHFSAAEISQVESDEAVAGNLSEHADDDGSSFATADGQLAAADEVVSTRGYVDSTFSPSSTGVPNDVSLATIKSLLEEWEEPVNKLDEKADATISDMLKFRKALSFMDGEFPFSAEFGPAGTRDQCILSAQQTYARLVDAVDSEVCPFAVLEFLAMNEDGTTNSAKVQRLKRLFRPDRYDEISNLAFIQTCDAVYKRLRFFRASVGNASVLQRVLEGIVDSVFNFALGLAILALLNFNPWPLLVSFSTLLVSCAFALGPSASRYIEGVLTIAFRRPYDLGDRILIEGATTRPAHDAARQSWLVEDVNLYGTTLRYAATNEVSTVPNGSIAQCRIVNLARSPNALVTVSLRFQLEVEDAKLAIFRSALQNFLRERPRTWLELVYFRCEAVNTEAKWLEYELRVRHAKSWQDGPRILQNRATLVKFCYETGKHLEMNYLGVVNQLEVFDGQHPYDPTAWLSSSDEAGKKAGDKKALLFPRSARAAAASTGLGSSIPM